MTHRQPIEMPGRVRAALEFLDYCVSATQSFDCSTQPQELSRHETAVRDAALDVLRLYFMGEMDYGDAPPRPPEDPPDEMPAPVPVPG